MNSKIEFATIPAIEYWPAAGRQLIRIKSNAVKDFSDNVIGREESRIKFPMSGARRAMKNRLAESGSVEKSPRLETQMQIRRAELAFGEKPSRTRETLC
jgi:hypothetical protein